MQLKLNKLQKLVSAALAEDSAGKQLKNEIARVLGPAIIVEGKLQNVIAETNDYLDVLDRTGRSGRLSWNPKVVTRWIDYIDPEIRKFAARTVSENTLLKMMSDRNADVRATVARRLPVHIVKEMTQQFPNDDELQSIFRTKLQEAGIRNPDIDDEPFDMYGKKRLGDAVKQNTDQELSDTWYDNLARKFMVDYGQNIEYAWEELAVRRFCSSVKATSGVDVDEEKLLDCIHDLIKEKEDAVLEKHSALDETLNWLSDSEMDELSENVNSVDSVQALVESRFMGEQYLEQASELFDIQESMLSLQIRKHRLISEGNAKQITVPFIGMLPHEHGFRVIDEQALDLFCENWNKQQQLKGEQLRLDWAPHNSDENKICFTCSLR